MASNVIEFGTSDAMTLCGDAKSADKKLLEAGDGPTLWSETSGRVAAEQGEAGEKIENRVRLELVPELQQNQKIRHAIARAAEKFQVDRMPFVDPNALSTAAVVVLVELICNAYFIGAYAPHLIIGLLLAMIWTALLVLVVGATVQIARHATVGGRMKRWSWRILSYVSLSVAFAIAFLSAHHREAVIVGDEASISFIQHAVAAPFQLTTESWLQFFVATAMATFLWRKWFSSTDNVPTFEALGRKLARSDSGVEQLRSDFANEIHAALSDPIKRTQQGQLHQRTALQDVVRFLMNALRRRGVRNPRTHEITDDDSVEVLDLMDRFVEATSRLSGNQEMGDVGVLLRSGDAESGGMEDAVRRVERLASARNEAEGIEWLDRIVDEIRFKEEKA